MTASASAARRDAATCAATSRSRSRRDASCATPSCGATSVTPPAPSGPKGLPRWPNAPTGRSCARRAARIKDDVLARLPELLEQLEANVIARGGVVHWARDARRGEPDRHRPGRAAGADEVVKVKSMATQEIGLNEDLAARGHRGDRDRPGRTDRPARRRHGPATSWCPAIHRNRAEIREIFTREMPGAGDLTDEPRVAGRWRPARTCAESSCPPRSRSAAPTSRIAETGTLAVVESEGNGRMCLTLPRHPDHRDGHREAGAALRATSRCSCSCCPGRRPPSG